DSYTFSRRPVKLVWAEAFQNAWFAISWEKKIKKWSRVKKEALINSDWEALKMNAVCRNATNSKRLLDQPGYVPRDVWRRIGE
ncbi:MAG TPA: rRNA methyltransferase, partial [Bacteroidia bacterium]|nr:rRNA methyltransferase [Bacteroidia bacterium]